MQSRRLLESSQWQLMAGSAHFDLSERNGRHATHCSLSAQPYQCPLSIRQLGQRIAERRKAQSLTQTQLGDLVGVTQQ